MTTTQRPPARKQTRRPAPQPAEEVYALKIDGEVYALRLTDLTGIHEMRLRRETGMSVEEVMSLLGSKPGLDVLGIFMWLCDMTDGGDKPLEHWLGSVSWASDLELIDGDDAPSAPEA